MRVTVFVEVQARFDERSNLEWGRTAGGRRRQVLYSYERLKVHAKLLLVEQREQGRLRHYAYLGTGSFHEGTARLYVDSALLTARPAITAEVQEVFRHLADRAHRPALKHLLMAPRGCAAGGGPDRPGDRACPQQPGRRHPAEAEQPGGPGAGAQTLRCQHRRWRSGLIIQGICCIVPGIRA